MLKERERAEYWFGEAPAMRAIAHMALPMMLGMAASTVYAFTDTLFVGMLRDTASLAAPTLAMPFSTVVMALADLVGVGGGTFIARRVGAHDRTAARAGSAFSFWAALALGLLVALLALPLMGPMLQALGAQGALEAPARAYVAVLAAGVPLSTLSFALCQVVRSSSDSMAAMRGMVGSSVLNIALDPLLIFGAGLGVGGAALATVASSGTAAVYYVYAISRNEWLSYNPFEGRLVASQLAEVLKVGTSAMLMALLMAASALAFNRCAVPFGEAAVAGFGVSQSIVQVIELVAMGLYEGVVPLVAAAYGAGDRQRTREVVGGTAALLLALCLVAGLSCFALRYQLVGLFSSDGAVLSDGARILTAQLAALLFASGSGLATGVFQAEGRGVAANAMSVVRGGAMMAAVIAGSTLFGFDGLVWALFAAEVASFAVAAALLAAGRLRPARVTPGGEGA